MLNDIIKLYAFKFDTILFYSIFIHIVFVNGICSCLVLAMPGINLARIIPRCILHVPVNFSDSTIGKAKNTGRVILKLLINALQFAVVDVMIINVGIFSCTAYSLNILLFLCLCQSKSIYNNYCLLNTS